MCQDVRCIHISTLCVSRLRNHKSIHNKVRYSAIISTFSFVSPSKLTEQYKKYNENDRYFEHFTAD